MIWSILNGTIVNTLTVLIGSAIGLSVGARIPERYNRIVLSGLGLITLGLGLDAVLLDFGATVAKYRPAGEAGKTFGAALALVVVASLLVGGVIGTLLRLHERLEKIGDTLHRRFAAGSTANVAQGFLTASMIFCVGPLTILGCLANGGPEHDPSLLYIKSVMDGFCSVALAATLGIGVGFSVLTVLLFQGGLALLASLLVAQDPDMAVALMTPVGGYLLIAIGLALLEIKSLPVTNYLPGVFLPPLLVPLLRIVHWLPH